MNDKQKALLDAARAVLAQHSMTSAAMGALEAAVRAIDEDARCVFCDASGVHICNVCGKCAECDVNCAV